MHRRGKVVGVLAIGLVLATIIGGIGYRVLSAPKSGVNQADLITQVASRGSFDHIVLEQGEIESSRNKEIVCEVKSRGQGGVAILWVVDEGTLVKEGDKLVELDTSQLELELKTQKIEVITAEAMVSTASALLKQSEIAKEEYLKGIFITEERAIQSEIQIAEQNKTRATLALQSSARLVAKGLVKELQMQADEYAVANAVTQLDSAENRLEVLRKYTKEKFLVQYNSEIESATASLKAAQSELAEESNELDEVLEQIAKCVMYAPSDGVVVYANKFSRRGGNAEFVVEPGALVREQQTILRLPDPGRMQVKCNINESRITLIKSGMPAKISIDAISGMTLTGRVKKVNRYAEPGSWFSSSVKEYATTIEIIDPPENIRTGMSAEAQIFVEQLDDALQIPIQGLYEHGGKMYSLIQQGEQKFETISVDLQATNDTMASVGGVIKEGDKVVLNLREHLSLMNLPSIIEDDNSDMKAMRMKPTATAVKQSDSESADPAVGKKRPAKKPAVQSTSKVQPTAATAGESG
ncbi:HlyD family secretion protein [Rubripirellula obstinata]|nr:HlyD family efflux transporter periplasmic adaptor subunit [Rubripirellula obstinata]